MNTKESESFIRWQSITREHSTFTSNVVMGLATGLLAFVSERLLSNSQPACHVLIMGLLSVLLLSLSIGLALWCSINRLRDFRATAQIARNRSQQQNLNEFRQETKILGKRSWLLFLWQLILFGIGTLISAVALLLRGFV